MGGNDAIDLIRRWMPLQCDRVLPGDLVNCMQSVGWMMVSHVPRIFCPIATPLQPRVDAKRQPDSLPVSQRLPPSPARGRTPPSSKSSCAVLPMERTNDLGCIASKNTITSL